METTDWVIDVKGLNKKFAKQPAVLDASMQVRRGEIMGFLGPNGTGKTTTIRMLCGLLTPNSGSGHCLGFDILKETNKIKAHVGYMPQYFSLYKNLTVFENLSFRAKLYGILDRKQKITKLLTQLGFAHRMHQIAGSLSGGWKQRLSLAAALLHDPLLLLLDEPTAGVDPKSRCDFWNLINDLSAKGITILLSSHNMDEVERCHRIAYMGYGTILQIGTIQEIINNIGITTWEVSGENLPLLNLQLQTIKEVEQITSSFDKLHIASRDPKKLAEALEPFRQNPHYHWRQIESNLEDTFVWLISHIEDTRYANK